MTCDCNAVFVYGPPPPTAEDLERAAKEFEAAVAEELRETLPAPPPELDESGMYLEDPQPVTLRTGEKP